MQRILSKRVWRELKDHFLRYLALFLLIVLGMYLIVAIVGSAEMIIRNVERGHVENRVEDGQFSVFVPLNSNEIAQIEGAGVTLEKAFFMDYRVGESTLRISKNREIINLFSLAEGTLPVKEGEILLEQHYAEANGILLGDAVAVGSKEFTVVGLGSTPDYDAVYESMSDSNVDSAQFGIGFVLEEDYEQLRGDGQSYKTEEYCYSYCLNDKVSNDELKELIQSFELDRSQVTDVYFREMLEEAEETKNDITDGIQELVDGSEELSDGLFEIAENNEDLRDAVDSLFEAMLKETNEGFEEAGISVVLTEETFEAQLDAMLANPGAYSEKTRQSLRDTKQSLLDLQEFKDGIEEYTDGVQEAADGSLELVDGVKELQEEADEMLEEYFTYDIDNLTSFVPREDNPRIGASINDVIINKVAGMVAGVIVMVLFTYVISVFVVHSIQQESSIIGALYALGVKRRQLLFHYLVLPVLITFLGGAVGCIIGFSPIGVASQAENAVSYFSLPVLKQVYPMYLLVYSLVMPPLAAVVVNCLVISKKLKRTALSLMRKEENAGNIREMNLGRMGFVSRFQIRQILRELRSAMAIVGGMFICLLVLMIGINCYVLCNNFSKASTQETQYEYLYTYKYPTEKVPEGGTEGYMESLTKEAFGYHMEVAILGLTKENPYFDVQPSSKKNEIVISSAVATKFAVKKGEKLVLTDEVNDRDYAFTIVDIVPYNSSLYAFMDIEAMRELFGQEEDYYNVVFAQEALDIESGRLYATTSKQSIEEASKVFGEMMCPMIIMMSSVSAIIFLVVMYLMMKVMIDRSAFSISLMKVFGYRKREIKKLYLDGNFLVVAVGAFVCVPLAKKVMDGIYPYFISNVPVGMELAFTWQQYAMIYGAIIVLYLIINQLLVRRLEKVNLAEILKNRE